MELQTNYNRIHIQRWFCIIIIVSQIIRGISGVLSFQLLPISIFDLKNDAFYIFLSKVLIYPTLFNNIIFSIVLHLAILCGAVIGLRKNNPILSFFTTISLLLYAAFINITLTHSQHYLALMVIISACFWTNNASRFDLLWNGAKYYVCWYYVSAFLFKLRYGALFQWDLDLINIKNARAADLFLFPNSVFSQFISFFIQHPTLTLIGEKIVYVAEFTFVVGFFTRKYDRLLQLLGIFIFVSTSIFIDVFFIENLAVLLLVLSPNKRFNGKIEQPIITQL